MLDLSKLENVREIGGGAKHARCPACAAAGGDRKGEHLWINAEGRFGCAAHQGDSNHRSDIWHLAGDKTQSISCSPTPPIIPAPNPESRVIRTITFRKRYTGDASFQLTPYICEGGPTNTTSKTHSLYTPSIENKRPQCTHTKSDCGEGPFPSPAPSQDEDASNTQFYGPFPIRAQWTLTPHDPIPREWLPAIADCPEEMMHPLWRSHPDVVRFRERGRLIGWERNGKGTYSHVVQQSPGASLMPQVTRHRTVTLEEALARVTELRNMRDAKDRPAATRSQVEAAILMLKGFPGKEGVNEATQVLKDILAAATACTGRLNRSKSSKTYQSLLPV